MWHLTRLGFSPPRTRWTAPYLSPVSWWEPPHWYPVSRLAPSDTPHTTVRCTFLKDISEHGISLLKILQGFELFTGEAQMFPLAPWDVSACVPSQVNYSMWCHSTGLHLSTLSSLQPVFPHFRCHPLAYQAKTCLNSKAQLKCHFFREDLLMAHEMEGNLYIFNSHSPCFYFFSNSFKCLFSWAILFGPLCLLWQVEFHFINEIITIYCIICIFV